MKDKLIIIGASGFGKEVAWLVERINEKQQKWDLLGFLDDNESLKGTFINGYEVLGTTTDIEIYKDAYFVCAIGSSTIREKIIEKIKGQAKNVKFATLIDPSAIVSKHIEIGEGSIICAGSVATVNIKIGKHTIVNLNSTIGHDVVIGDYVTFYPSVNVSGNDRIEDSCEVGTGAQLKQNISVAKKSVIGAGAVVVKDIKEKGTYMGVPARKIV